MSSVGEYYCRGQRDYGKDAVASYISIVDLGGSVYSVCFVGAAETAAPPTVSVRRLIGLRSVSDQIAFGTQSVRERCTMT